MNIPVDPPRFSNHGFLEAVEPVRQCRCWRCRWREAGYARPCPRWRDALRQHIFSEKLPARRVGTPDAVSWPVAMRPHVLGMLALLPHAQTMVGPSLHLLRPSAAATRSAGVSCAAAGGDRKSRKAKAHAQQMKTMDAKLEGDASFFWQCVARHQSGGVISGISGLVPVKRDAAYLFGEAANPPAHLPHACPHACPPTCPPACPPARPPAPLLTCSPACPPTAHLPAC